MHLVNARARVVVRALCAPAPGGLHFPLAPHPKPLGKLLMAVSRVDSAWHIPDSAFDLDFGDTDLRMSKASVLDY